MDTTLAAIAILAWTFLLGMLAGVSLSDRRREKETFQLEPYTIIDEAFDECVREVRNFETFAGLAGRSAVVIRDHDGSDWRLTIEREKA